jgi:sugar/nucleoside kinase (ribokinase family)
MKQKDKNILEHAHEIIYERAEESARKYGPFSEGMEKVAQLSKFVVLDSKKKLKEETIKMFDFVKMNESEFKNNFTDKKDLLDKIIITLGSKGAKHNEIHYHSENPKETIDVSGAGDTFVAAFTKKYLETNDVSISISFANKLSGKVVSKRGVSVV